MVKYNELHDLILKLRTEGRTLNEIMEATGKCKGTIYYWLNKVSAPPIDRSAAARKAYVKRRLNLAKINSQIGLPKEVEPFSVFKNGNTKAIGETSELIIMSHMLANGYKILQPYGDNQRYDFVIDNGNLSISRVQCKTARYKNGKLIFSAASNCGHLNRSRKKYAGEVEFFATYCPELDKCYLIPMELIGKRNHFIMRYGFRFDKTILNAKDYEI